MSQSSDIGPRRQENLRCPIEKAGEKVMAEPGAPLTSLPVSTDVTDLRGAVTAAIERKMED